MTNVNVDISTNQYSLTTAETSSVFIQRLPVDDLPESFRHKGLKKLYQTGSTSGVQPKHAARLRTQLAALDTAQEIDDMDIPGFKLHPLKGKLKGRWSISVSGKSGPNPSGRR